ncbi:hypothetical protein BC835DRAFT_1418037 [Cytidiella melzeri]|nr:hypothetical protein BC835DRAFT_1418037 [Cytidiella melzeri]
MFLTLPDELLVSILAWLCTTDRVRCELVNHRLKLVIDKSTLLQALTECEIADVEFNFSRPAAPLADLVRSLQERREAWKTLRWTSSTSVPVLQRDGEAPLVIWLRGGESQLGANVQGRDCGILAQVTPDDRLVFTQIPSKVRNIPGRTWVVDGLPVAIAQFALDERQGLLIVAETVFEDATGLTEVKLHSLRLPTGAAHPLASGPISLTMPPSNPATRSPVCEMVIAGEFIGIMVHTSFLGHQSALTSHFSLCNWRTAEVILTLWCGCDDKVSNSASFAFLSPEYILIPRFKYQDEQHELTVIRTRGPPGKGTYFDISANIVAIFDLPELQAGAKIWTMHSLRAPSPSFSPTCDSAVGESDYVTFTYTPKSQMLTFIVEYLGSFGRLQKFRFYVPVPSFLSCLPPPSTSGSTVIENLTSDEGIAHIPWQDWGIDVRVTPHYRSKEHNPCSHTCFFRYEHVVNKYGLRSFDTLVKYDFPSVMQMRRESQLSSSGSVFPESTSSSDLSLIQIDYCLGREAVDIEDDDLWVYPVYSAPYRRTVMKLAYGPACISEDAVILQDIKNM